MKKKELAEIVRRIKKKIETDSPYVYNNCSLELRMQIVETFYRIVLDEMAVNENIKDFDVEMWDKHFKDYEPITPLEPMHSMTQDIPEPTDKFIINEIVRRTDDFVKRTNNDVWKSEIDL